MFISVKARILTIVGAIVLASLVLIIALNVHLVRSQHGATLERYALMVSNNLSAQLQHLLGLGIPLTELVGFEQQCYDAVAANKDIAYARVIAPDGTILFHSDPTEHGRQPPDAFEALTSGRETVVKAQSGVYLDAQVPLRDLSGELLGAVSVGLRQQALSEPVEQLVLASVGAGLLALLGTLGVLLAVLSRIVIRPLDRLHNSIRGLVYGDRLNFDMTIDARSNDEFGTIAAAFDLMTQTLKTKDGELRQHIEELQQQSHDLRQAIAQANEANEANEAKSQFLANMSHELRTPLNGVLGMIELVTDDPLSAQQREMLANAQRCGEHLLSVINDLLDYSKLEAGKLELVATPFELSTLTTQALKLFAAGAREKGLVLHNDIAPGLPVWVRGDALRLRQILINLIGNAIKFTERGGISVSVEQDQDGRVRFTVHDTGCGISPAESARLFRPFSQADASTTRRFGGTGLGLAICKQLTEQMGGQIGFNSTPDTGTAFWFTVPLPATDAVTVTQPSTPPVTAADKLYGRVLLVEDNPINRLVALTMLNLFGLEADVAENGAEAVERATAYDYDAILMDCQMPVLDGFVATRRLREIEASGGQPRRIIIALTANALSGDRERCLAAGMDDYLSKPFSRSALNDTLQRWLRSPVESEAGTA